MAKPFDYLLLVHNLHVLLWVELVSEFAIVLEIRLVDEPSQVFSAEGTLTHALFFEMQEVISLIVEFGQVVTWLLIGVDSCTCKASTLDLELEVSVVHLDHRAICREQSIACSICVELLQA